MDDEWVEQTYAKSLDEPILAQLETARTTPMIYDRDGWTARTCRLVADARNEIVRQAAEIDTLKRKLAALDQDTA